MQLESAIIKEIAGLFPTHADFVYRNAFLIMKLSKLQSFRVIQAHFGNRFVIGTLFIKTIICSSVKMKKSHKFL